MHPLIAGNWKMNGLSPQLGEIEAIATWANIRPPDIDILICPPATLIARAAQVAAGHIAVGGQNSHAQISGAFTGDLSAEMLKDAGASAVIVGHSERRQNHGETDAIVAAKAKAAWRSGLLAIICVGEAESQRQDGKALSVCGAQIAGSVPSGITAITTAVAYEPRWAIGTGRTPTSDEITEVHAHIRRCLAARFDAEGNDMRILFGGSVKASNAREILALADVGGALLGGANLKAGDFEEIFRVLSARD